MVTSVVSEASFSGALPLECCPGAITTRSWMDTCASKELIANSWTHKARMQILKFDERICICIIQLHRKETNGRQFHERKEQASRPRSGSRQRPSSLSYRSNGDSKFSDQEERIKRKGVHSSSLPFNHGLQRTVTTHRRAG
jgi:hypothetical protein